MRDKVDHRKDRKDDLDIESMRSMLEGVWAWIYRQWSPSLSLKWNVRGVQKKKDRMKSLGAVEKGIAQLTRIHPATA